MSKLAFRAQTVDIAYLPLRQDLFAKNVLMTVQRDFHLGNSLLRVDSKLISERIDMCYPKKCQKGRCDPLNSRF